MLPSSQNIEDGFTIRSLLLGPQLLQIALVIILIVTGILCKIYFAPIDPVPLSIRRSVPFIVYYPDAKKLPSGCFIDPQSFTMPQRGVVLFAVVCADGKLILSEQQQPPASDIQKFYANFMPHHRSMRTSIGNAEAGLLINGMTIQNAASLLAGNGPWIIVTASPTVSQQYLQQVVQSIVR